MLTEERRRAVLQVIRSETSVQTADLADRFGVSEMTIRRDLDELAEHGLVRRVHGGAVAPRAMRDEPPFDDTRVERASAKQRVGQAAAAMVQPGDTVIIDIGTTALQVARCLHDRPGLTVVTNNMAVYDELAGDDTIDLLLLGGLLRRNYRSLTGFLTEESLRGIRADLVFVGISGVSEDLTLLDTTVEEIQTKRAMLRAAAHRVLIADGAKFWGGGLGRVAGIDAVQTVITTDDAPDDRLDAIRDQGVEVRIA
jgi:DeoR/GlpR family transcriptional regulator of sugar metabolism